MTEMDSIVRWVFQSECCEYSVEARMHILSEAVRLRKESNMTDAELARIAVLLVEGEICRASPRPELGKRLFLLLRTAGRILGN